MNLIADRSDNLYEENSFQDRLLEKLYGNLWGRMLLRPLISPAVSRIGGRILSSGISRLLIAPFIRAHQIPMKDYEKRKYKSYNDFFTRKLAPGARLIESRPESFISPCDSRLGVYKIDEDSILTIKHTSYTVAGLVRSRALAEHFAGGYVWVFRLCVEDYHRYIYVDSGKVSAIRRIPGVFHTVNPAANDRFPIYKENTREYALLETEQFGTILQMEVGALLVGKIENRPGERSVRRGEEKGNFAFGGSTIILLTEKNMVCPDADILKNSALGIETKVKLGEQVGRRRGYEALSVY